MTSKRGRKRNDSLPPSRAREIQRAFRARRAAHLEALEERVAVLEQENQALRDALQLPPSDRPPLGRGPTGTEKPQSLSPSPATSQWIEGIRRASISNLSEASAVSPSHSPLSSVAPPVEASYPLDQSSAFEFSHHWTGIFNNSDDGATVDDYSLSSEQHLSRKHPRLSFHPDLRRAENFAESFSQSSRTSSSAADGYSPGLTASESFDDRSSYTYSPHEPPHYVSPTTPVAHYHPMPHSAGAIFSSPYEQPGNTQAQAVQPMAASSHGRGIHLLSPGIQHHRRAITEPALHALVTSFESARSRSAAPPFSIRVPSPPNVALAVDR